MSRYTEAQLQKAVSEDRVRVLPTLISSTVWVVVPNNIVLPIKCGVVKAVSFTKNKIRVQVKDMDFFNKYYEWGERVFEIREEATRKLEELRNGSK